MDQNEFIYDHLNRLTHSLSKEKKTIYIAGDWNFNLLEFSKHKETLTFYETMMSNFLAPSITIPTRITLNGGTLIDNIFTNSITLDRTSGNLTVGISDHFPSFLFIPVENNQLSSPATVQYKRDTKNFSKEYFILDYLDIDLSSELELKKSSI